MNAHRRASFALAALGAIGVGCSSNHYAGATTPVSAGDGVVEQSYATGAEFDRPAPGQLEGSFESAVAYEEVDAPPTAAAAPAPTAASSSRATTRQVASNATPTTPATPNAPATPSAIDAPVHRDLIIYTAAVVLAIYEVDQTERALAAAATEAGGFVASLDARTLVVRIPAASFDAFLARIEGAGQVLDRRIVAEDVTEQFRDLQIRLENLTAMRDRLEAMLARAANVQDAIQVERELERVTTELESLRGRIRYLADRVAYSTITIRFQPLPREQLAGNVPTQLPVPWLQTLGLSTLMR